MSRFFITIDRMFNGVKTEDITEPIIHHPRKKEEEKPLIVIPADQSYVEICGHRIDEVNGFEGFMEYLKQRNDFENEYNYMCRQRAALIDYLKTRLEEGKLMSTYENGIRYPSAQERIYEDLLERVESGNYE